MQPPDRAAQFEAILTVPHPFGDISPLTVFARALDPGVAAVFAGVSLQAESPPGQAGNPTQVSSPPSAALRTVAWGEAVDGVQLRLSLATSGPTALPGELPALDL
jgi:hypothetical protein